MIPSMRVGVEPVAKLGSPKVHLQALTGYEQNGNTATQHEPDKLETHYKGKSAILRRPKYQAVAYPRRLEDKRGYNGYVGVTPNQRVTTENARRIAAAHESRARRVTLRDSREGRDNPSMPHVSKAFNSERQRHRREGLYEGGAAGGSVASAIEARRRGRRARELRDEATGKTTEGRAHLLEAAKRTNRLGGADAPAGGAARAMANTAGRHINQAGVKLTEAERMGRKAAWAARQSKLAAAGSAGLAAGAYGLHRLNS